MIAAMTVAPKPAVVLVEDDPIQMNALRLLVQRRFPSAELIPITCEQQFLQSLEVGCLAPAKAIVMDCHLDWSDRSSVFEDGDHTPYLAGIRCLKAMQVYPELSGVPVLFRTLMNTRNVMAAAKAFEGAIRCFGKDSDDDEDLLRYLGGWLSVEVQN